MKIVDCSSKLLKYDVHKPLEFIEKVGRVCYKSEDAIKEGSAEKFFNRLVKNGHFAMLEHATFVFQVSEELYGFLLNLSGKKDTYSEDDVSDGLSHLNFTGKIVGPDVRYIISGNLRSINNTRFGGFLRELGNLNPALVYKNPGYEFDYGYYCKLISNIFDLPDLSLDEVLYHCYLSFLCTTDRGVTHELVRHREMSFAQESTRYCNYSKGKFDNELTFIKPFFYSKGDHATEQWLKSCKECEKRYLNLLAQGVSPQGARSVLTNSLASTIVMTANIKEFIHFFNLRYAGKTGMPHPDMMNLARKMYGRYEEFIQNNVQNIKIQDQLNV